MTIFIPGSNLSPYYDYTMGHLTDTKVSQKNLTTVPKPVRNFLAVEQGDHLEWHVVDGDIIVRKADDE